MSSGNSRFKPKKRKPLKMNHRQEMELARLVFGVADTARSHLGRQWKDQEVAWRRSK